MSLPDESSLGDVGESLSVLSLDVAVRALETDGLLPPSGSFYPLVVDLPQETIAQVGQSSEERIAKRI